MGGVGKWNKKCSKTPKICTNLKELGVILRNLKNFLLEIVVWGVGILGNRVANFRKNGVGGGLQLGTGEYRFSSQKAIRAEYIMDYFVISMLYLILVRNLVVIGDWQKDLVRLSICSDNSR